MLDYYNEYILAVIVLVGLVCVFYTVSLLCDEHLVPAIDVLIRQYNIPEEVAAVTLIAFGSATPEIVLNSVSAIENTVDLSLPACLGSGVIAFGLVPALCVLATGKNPIILKPKLIVREVSRITLL